MILHRFSSLVTLVSLAFGAFVCADEQLHTYRFGSSPNNQLTAARYIYENTTPFPVWNEPTLTTNNEGSVTLAAVQVQPGDTRTEWFATPANWVSVSSGVYMGMNTHDAPVYGMHLTTADVKPSPQQETALGDALALSGRSDIFSGSGATNAQRHNPFRSGGSNVGSDDTAIVTIDIADAPTDWTIYNATGFVLLHRDVWASVERQPLGEALRLWVTTGGLVVIYGADSDTTEPMNMGTIVTSKTNPYTSPDKASEMLPTINGPSWTNFSTSVWDYSGAADVLAGQLPVLLRRDMPLLVPITFAVLFYLIGGIGNYVYLKSKNKLPRLFLTVPAISFVFCIILAIAFFSITGFTRRVAAVSVTLVDGQGRAVEMARASFFSGLFPLEGFHWTNETFFLPTSLPDGYGTWNLGQGRHLSSGLVESLRPITYLTTRPYETRETIRVDVQNGELRVLNGYEREFETIIVQHDGAFYAAKDVPIGGSAPLKPHKDLDPDHGELEQAIISITKIADVEMTDTRPNVVTHGDEAYKLFRSLPPQQAVLTPMRDVEFIAFTNEPARDNSVGVSGYNGLIDAHLVIGTR